MALAPEQMELLEQFEHFYQAQDREQLISLLDELQISDIADLLSEEADYAFTAFDLMPIHRAASVFKILEQQVQEDVIKELPPQKVAELLNELPADDRTSFLEELPSNTVKELIKLLDPDERRKTLALLGYKEDSVGRLMTPDYIAVYENWSVQNVLDYIRNFGMDSETIDVIYVIDEQGKFVDDVRIREFILRKPDTLVSELIDGRFITLNVDDDQSVANDVFKMNNRVALPVVDNNNVLLGIVTIDDVLWVTNEEYTEDIQKIGGTEAFDEPYLDIAISKLVRKRAGWLVLLFIGEMFTATAMQFFQGEIEKVVVLSLFIPLIMSSGGNSGSQASTLIIQAMALGEVTLSDWWRVMRRELISGMLLGLILGLIGFIRISVWQNLHFYDYGEHWVMLALAISSSVTGIVLWGSLMGSMMPIILKRFKLDPAASSAPFVATMVDVTGVLIYFSMAYLFLKGTLL
ncbi:MAG: magnesium transporter [Chitinophagaceae bacterium]|uniref:Magnesium transporter MgtE n=1 Tax=Rurimicrobium arvi TaxID=2049916 RepID=A0ABP8MZY4_9BACT